MIPMTTRPALQLLSPGGSRPSKGDDMERVTGPECPQCGCEQAEAVSSGTWWGQPVDKLLCDNCGTTFSATARIAPTEGKRVVKFIRMRCPSCGSKNVKTTSTRGSIRWHKCSDCQRPFQSVED